MDKLTALRVFRRVVERESFSRAAGDLRLSTAAISKNVRELESELGTPLIHRTTRRLNLTPVGRAYYERTVAILDALTEADRDVKDLASSPRGLLRVAAPVSLGLAIVVPAINEFVVEHPDVEIELDMNDRMIDIVAEGFDLAIRGSGALADSSLVAKKLGRIDRVVVASPHYVERRGRPATPRDLARHRCLVYTLWSSPKRWTFTRGAKKEAVDIGGPLRINNGLALVQAAVAGIGVALVPAVTAVRELADDRLVPLLADWEPESQSLHAVYSRHRETSKLVRVFVDHVARRISSR